MAILDPNHAIGNLHGLVGDLVFARTKNGKIVVRHRPIRKVEFQGGELVNQARFALAVEYVRRIRAQPDLYQAYVLEALRSNKRACDLANADFWHRPVIHGIDLAHYTGQPGEVIRIQATDDFAVVAVSVTIAALDGRVIEQGAATQTGTTADWAYTAQTVLAKSQTVVVRVSAMDRPENTVTSSVGHVIA